VAAHELNAGGLFFLALANRIKSCVRQLFRR
jgi:hypothetical protein